MAHLRLVSLCLPSSPPWTHPHISPRSGLNCTSQTLLFCRPPSFLHTHPHCQRLLHHFPTLFHICWTIPDRKGLCTYLMRFVLLYIPKIRVHRTFSLWGLIVFNETVWRECNFCFYQHFKNKAWGKVFCLF